MCVCERERERERERKRERLSDLVAMTMFIKLFYAFHWKLSSDIDSANLQQKIKKIMSSQNTSFKSNIYNIYNISDVGSHGPPPLVVPPPFDLWLCTKIIAMPSSCPPDEGLPPPIKTQLSHCWKQLKIGAAIKAICRWWHTQLSSTADNLSYHKNCANYE